MVFFSIKEAITLVTNFEKKHLGLCWLTWFYFFKLAERVKFHDTFEFILDSFDISDTIYSFLIVFENDCIMETLRCKIYKYFLLI